MKDEREPTNEREHHGDSTAADGGTGSIDAAGTVANEIRPTKDEGRTERFSEGHREFLLEAVRRAPLLQSLRSGAVEPSGLLESVDVSRSTLHRSINSLEEYDIVQKSDDEYELTALGEILAQELESFSNQALTAVSLSQFLNSIEMNGNGIPVEHFGDANVTRRESRRPHVTIHRIIQLIERSDDLRMFSTVISPVYVDVGYREMMNGMEIEAIFDREVVELMLAEYPEKAYETISTGNFDVYAHEELPFELFLFDDRMGMAAHNENGNAEIFVECDDPDAVEWAEDLYSEHFSKAEPISLSEEQVPTTDRE